MKSRQTGFTLVEIAIVLVIIGLLLGGVLKGQELINSAKSKAVISDFRNTATMIAAYQDRFRALPGDDASVATHLQGATQASSASSQTVGNGLIEGAFDSTTESAESVLMWQHLRLANLAAGDSAAPTATNLSAWRPKNSEGGVIGVQSTNPLTAGTWGGRQFICQQNISGRIAQQVDTTMDDGKPDGGSVRFGNWDSSTHKLTPVAAPSGSSSSASSGAVVLDENSLYTVCASF